ncbi:MAG TPA: hypothetical protein PKI09_12985 [Dermatophilaceae bacterium]|nr:hypothetical protein [Dermatophilaceae bacterium]HPZ70430.1 hypothetical protein [Dermatophilaceae bacterium]HQD03022.1 hypothetical protein [Dermatophilaceae bacterium]
MEILMDGNGHPDPQPLGFRLVVGAPAPQQLDGRTCGPTALTTARMLRDPALADWVRTGAKHGRAFPDGPTPQERLAAYHALVHARTNALVGPGGRLQVPWPRALGTTPWGVCRELESGAADPGARYRIVTVRRVGEARLIELVERLAGHLRPGRPGVLFVGSATLPRHVALLVPGPDGSVLVHDPSAGSVSELDVTALADERITVAGWTHPWFLVGPVG